MKYPDKITQQTLHTAYMEHAINNKNINMTFVKKQQNVANKDLSS